MQLLSLELLFKKGDCEFPEHWGRTLRILGNLFYCCLLNLALGALSASANPALTALNAGNSLVSLLPSHDLDLPQGRL